MAKKSRQRQKKASSQSSLRRPQVTQGAPRSYSRLILGGLVIALVLGLGAAVRSYWQRSIPPRLQEAIDNHYTRGPAEAPVVVKEFSDYT